MSERKKPNPKDDKNQLGKSIPKGISVIHFDDASKDVHAEVPADKEQAKRLSRRIYKDAMSDISAEKKDNKPQ